MVVAAIAAGTLDVGAVRIATSWADMEDVLPAEGSGPGLPVLGRAEVGEDLSEEIAGGAADDIMEGRVVEAARRSTSLGTCNLQVVRDELRGFVGDDTPEQLRHAHLWGVLSKIHEFGKSLAWRMQRALTDAWQRCASGIEAQVKMLGAQVKRAWRRLEVEQELQRGVVMCMESVVQRWSQLERAVSEWARRQVSPYLIEARRGAHSLVSHMVRDRVMRCLLQLDPTLDRTFGALPAPVAGASAQDEPPDEDASR